MKYFILSRNDILGIPGNDSKCNTDITKYFELGWEIVSSRFEFIKLVNENILDSREVAAITTRDRMFMYSSFYDNVIAYEDFSKMQIDKKDIIFDCTRNYLTIGSERNMGQVKYHRSEQDGELIFNGFNLNDTINPEQEFVVMAIRNRDWADQRNSNKSFFLDIAKNIQDKYKIYVAGRHNEEFCKQYGFHYLDSLKDYTALIKHNHCKGLVTQSCGLALLALICAECNIYFIDHTRCSGLRSTSAISGGTQVQFFTKDLYPYFDISNNTVREITERILNV